MRILIVGSGAREHALCYALRENTLFVMPGNPGMKSLATLIPGDILDPERVLQVVRDHEVELVLIGPEAPLAAGISDLLREENIWVFGPNREASRLESSKAFAKEFMRKYQIPTADYVVVEDEEHFLQYADKNYVIKADGLAGGKGVFIPQTQAEYKAIGESLFRDKSLGASAELVVLEEYLEGSECSFFYLVNNHSYTYLGDAKDHKKAFEGERGPNTGGMGAISPVMDLCERELTQMHEIMERVYAGLHQEGLSFQGVLFIGAKRAGDGLKVLEFNVRFGDPETQSLLLRIESDFTKHIIQVAMDQPLDEVKRTDQCAVGVVLASENYPDKPLLDQQIQIGELEDVFLFHGGTKEVDGELYNSSGRVFTLVALESEVLKASEKVYKEISKIHFNGSRYRKDII